MKLYSSRQAWHDAYYPKIRSTNIWGAERLISNQYPFKAVNHYHDYQLIHCCLAGKVQHAIASLPRPLQSFGHYLYSPLATSYDLKIAHQLITCIYNRQTPHEFDQEQQKKLNYLIFVVLKDYQGLVINQKSFLKTYKKINKYLQHNYQIMITLEEWKKQWQTIYDQLMCLCGELDKKALQPVVGLLHQRKEIKNETEKTKVSQKGE